MTIEEKAEYAAQLKMYHGYNCSQAVAVALSDETELPEETLKNVAAGFCAGMGTMEATCGALIGAVMIAGLKTGGEATLPCSRKMLLYFREHCGALTCKDLKARDENGKPLCPCEDCVRNAVRAYGAVLGETEE